MALLFKRPTPDLSSGLDFSVVSSSPMLGWAPCAGCGDYLKKR